jgi:hypothetical protein
MESSPEPKTTPTNGKLSGSAIDNTREQEEDTIQSWNRKKKRKTGKQQHRKNPKNSNWCVRQLV